MTQKKFYAHISLYSFPTLRPPYRQAQLVFTLVSATDLRLPQSLLWHAAAPQPTTVVSAKGLVQIVWVCNGGANSLSLAVVKSVPFSPPSLSLHSSLPKSNNESPLLKRRLQRRVPPVPKASPPRIGIVQKVVHTSSRRGAGAFRAWASLCKVCNGCIRRRRFILLIGVCWIAAWTGCP